VRERAGFRRESCKGGYVNLGGFVPTKKRATGGTRRRAKRVAPIEEAVRLLGRVVANLANVQFQFAMVNRRLDALEKSCRKARK